MSERAAGIAAPPVRAREVQHDVLAPGALSGLLGGLAMIALAMLSAAVQGIAVEAPLDAMGETFVGAGALGGAAKVALGVLVHAVTSAALGLAFAAVAPRELSPGSAVGLGVGFALLAMGVLTTVVVPSVDPGFRAGIQPLGGTWVAGHGLFGAALGLAPGLRRRLRGAAARA